MCPNYKDRCLHFLLKHKKCGPVKAYDTMYVTLELKKKGRSQALGLVQKYKAIPDKQPSNK